MKSTNSVIASMKAAARTFVRTNRKQMLATLPKAEPAKRATRKRTAKLPGLDVQAVTERLNLNTIWGLRDIRRLMEQAERSTGNKYSVQRFELDTLLFVHRETNKVHGTITMTIKGGKRYLTAKCRVKSGRLTNYIHREGRVLSFHEMFHDMRMLTTLARQTKQIHAYIMDDIGELADSLIADIHSMNRTGERLQELRAKSYNALKRK